MILMQRQAIYSAPTNYGHFFASADGGDTWTGDKIPLDLQRGYHVYPMVSG